MSLLSPTAPAFDQVCVALDLETTGLDENRDTIIEVGAVKFREKR
jgi:DNA polymerase III epsilon subunit-like protein